PGARNPPADSRGIGCPMRDRGFYSFQFSVKIRRAPQALTTGGSSFVVSSFIRFRNSSLVFSHPGLPVAPIVQVGLQVWQAGDVVLKPLVSFADPLLLGAQVEFARHHTGSQEDEVRV